MHRKVIKISSGGVHNICIVEPQPSQLLEDIYKQFINALYTDVVFKGFHQSYDANQQAQVSGDNVSIDARIGSRDTESNQNLNSSQHSYSDEDMRDGSVSGQDINIAS